MCPDHGCKSHDHKFLTGNWVFGASGKPSTLSLQFCGIPLSMTLQGDRGFKPSRRGCLPAGIFQSLF